MDQDIDLPQVATCSLEKLRNRVAVGHIDWMT
jgi:hypothetical protein